MSDPITGIAQRCFVGDDGYRRCNFVFRNRIARWTKSGKWWTFSAFPFAIFRRKKSLKGVKGKTATPHVEK